MPQALGLIGLFFFNAGLTGLANLAVGLQGVLVGLGGVGLTALQVGLGLLSSLLFAPKQPKPEDVQASSRNPVAPRVRHYGRMKVSGPWAFGEVEKGNFWKVLALQSGEADAFEEIWVDDRAVTLDGSGFVQEEPYKKDGSSKLQIWTRRGLPVETHYAELGAAFAEWDADHRGDGVASICVKQIAMGQDRLMETFSNLSQTGYRIVGRWSKVLNPATEAIEWSDNAAAVIRDYATHPDGARLPAELFETPQAKAGWIAAFQRAAEPVERKAGGTEPRYRLWTSYTFNERPADVLGRMFACSDALLKPTPDGGVTLDIGAWYEPSVVLDEDAIVAFTDLSRGADILTTANVIAATFLSPEHDYQATDADPWVDEDDVEARGEIVSDLAFNAAPSHGQARRLMKLAAYRAKPRWLGTFQFNMRGLAAFGERFVRIVYPAFEIDEVFEISDFRFNIGEGMLLTGCTLVVRSMPAEAYAWDAPSEEGEAPIAEATDVDDTIPLPIGFTFTEQRQSASGVAFSVGLLAWTAPPAGLQTQAQYRKVGDPGWTALPIPTDATSVRTAPLDDGVQYEAQLRSVSLIRTSEWTTPTLKLTPLANPNAPLALSSFTATGDLGRAALTFATASDVNLSKIALYRVPAGATLNKSVHTKIVLAAAPGTSFSYVDGDATRTTLVANGGAAADTDWTKGSGWTISGGKFVKASAAATSNVEQAVSLPAGTLRWALDIDALGGSGSALVALLSPTVLSADQTATGANRSGKLVNASSTALGLRLSAARTGTFDNLRMFLETPACAPSGVWDYYAFPLNPSGVEGPQALAAGVFIA